MRLSQLVGTRNTLDTHTAEKYEFIIHITKIPISNKCYPDDYKNFPHIFTSQDDTSTDDNRIRTTMNEGC